MKRWQTILSEHCSIDIINENSVRVNNASWNPDTKESFDDYISLDDDINAFVVDTVNHVSSNYDIVETKTYKSIYDYLNY